MVRASSRIRRLSSAALAGLLVAAALAPAAFAGSPGAPTRPGVREVTTERMVDYGDAHESMDGMRGDHLSGADDEGFGGPSAAAMIGVMAVLIGAAVVGLLWLSRSRSGGETPLEILDRRYANGELSDEQYRESKRLLEGG